jgi:hypothetical protein
MGRKGGRDGGGGGRVRGKGEREKRVENFKGLHF